MNRQFKKFLQSVVGPLAAAVPVRRWPSLFGQLYDVRVPSRIREQSPPATRGPANTNVLFDLLDEIKPVPGDIAECGVYRGGTLIPMALYVSQQSLDVKLYGFDSFAGFGNTIDTDLALGGAADSEKHRGGFSSTSQEYVQSRIDALGLKDCVVLVNGYFAQAFSEIPARPWRFVHIDGDTYEAYRACLEYFWPKLSVGGIILFDEYQDPPWPGCDQAVNEFVRQRGIEIRRIERNGYFKFYIQK